MRKITLIFGLLLLISIVSGCSQKVTEDNSIYYIDANGINQGAGVEIDGIIWAPVNCGYAAGEYEYGKLYQWGRKDGQCYDGEGKLIMAEDNPNSLEQAEPNTYYKNWDANIAPEGTWGGEDGITRTSNDPCPEGWRVPNIEEMKSLTANKSVWAQVGEQLGYWFTGKFEYNSTVKDKIFLNAAGFIWRTGVDGRDYDGSFWTSNFSKKESGKSEFLYLNIINAGCFSESHFAAISVRCVYANN